MELIKQYGWKKTENWVKILHLLREKEVIDGDLVERTIAMFHVRYFLIKEYLDKNDLKLVDEIVRQNIADINLFLKQVKEYTSAANNNKKNKIFINCTN